jgi:hypothetical protein
MVIANYSEGGSIGRDWVGIAEMPGKEMPPPPPSTYFGFRAGFGESLRSVTNDEIIRATEERAISRIREFKLLENSMLRWTN